MTEVILKHLKLTFIMEGKQRKFIEKSIMNHFNNVIIKVIDLGQ